MKQIDKGRYFESLAVDYLLQKGWLLLEKNWHCREGELDLVMQDEEGLVFVEVKGRKSRSFGSVVESLTTAKVRRMKRTVSRWRAARQNYLTGRLLFVGIEQWGGQIEITELPIE